MNCDAVAISVRFRRRDDRSQRNILKLADSLKNVAHLPPFNRQLMFVADVLVCASAASTKIRALRCDAMRRAFLNFNQFRLGELLFLANDLSGNQFALDRVWNEGSLPLLASDSFPAKSDVFNFQIDNAHIKDFNRANRKCQLNLILTFLRDSSFVLHHSHHGLATSRTCFTRQDRQPHPRPGVR